MYTLNENYYNELSYFIPELQEDNIYHLDKDQLIQDYDRDLIIKVLDYYNNGNLDFINKDNYKECFEIFLHFGSEIGILFDYYNGIVIKKLNVLKNIKLYYNSSKKDYGLVVQFNRDIYNYNNKLKYGRLFDMYFSKLQFNMEILNYDSYDIKYDILPYKEKLEKYKDSYKIKIYSNKKLNKGDFGSNLTHIIFGEYFDQEIEENVLPDSLSHITFNGYFNKKIKENVLPNSLKYIDLGCHYNLEIKKNVLPNSLTHLIFSTRFDQEIKESVLPNSLIYIKFNTSFNKEIKKNVLPESLIYIIFGAGFWYEIRENVLPDSITDIIFDSFYDKKIKKNVLPKSLQYIKIRKELLDESYINNHDIVIRPPRL